MRYLLLLKSDENAVLGPPPQELLEAIGRHGAEMTEAGVLLGTGGLAPTAMSSRVQLTEGAITVAEGPFTDAKVQVNAYALVQAASNAEAADIAAQFLAIHAKHWPGWEGEAEVRQAFGPDA